MSEQDKANPTKIETENERAQAMSEEDEEEDGEDEEDWETHSQKPTGRLVVEYLQEQKQGATVADILRHLRAGRRVQDEDLNKIVQSILENGTQLGFLEKKGSHYRNWCVRESCGLRRRRRRRSCRRRRRLRRRSCRRRRKKRCCCSS